jgi:hypothetical protein
LVIVLRNQNGITLFPEFKHQTTGLIAGKFLKELEGTHWSTGAENNESRQDDGAVNTPNKEMNGGADGARIRDLQRDRAKFFVLDFA